ncbi:MAG: DUF2835 family protein [Pseudomonadales bacterium]|nr:DUF2835 family protein [Pseudomonadales bacterium]
MTRELVVDLALTREQYLSLYRTYIRQVRTVARNGQTVRFPVSLLQPFVGYEGVRGSFRISCDANGKFKAIERLA